MIPTQRPLEGRPHAGVPFFHPDSRSSADAGGPLSRNRGTFQRDTVQETPEASILIVGYRSKAYIARCISGAINASQRSQVEILFLDCSDDGSVDLVREQFPMVRTFPHQGNLGFARGNNFLANEARGRKILLLNPDAFCEGTEIDALLEFSRSKPDGGAWGAVTVLPSGRIDPGSTQPMLGPVSLFMTLIGLARFRPGRLRPDKPIPQRVAVLTGAFMLVRADVWRALGGFDIRYFMYTEEVDLCRRIADYGCEIWAEPRIRLLHDTGSGSPRSAGRLVQLCRGNATFLDKHFGPVSSALCKSIMWTQGLTRALYGRCFGKQDYVDGFGAVVRRRSEWWNGWPEPADPDVRGPA